MTGQEQAGRFGFDLRHQFAIIAIAEVILRNRLRVKNSMLKRRLAFHTQQHAQILTGEREQFLRRQ